MSAFFDSYWGWIATIGLAVFAVVVGTLAILSIFSDDD